MEKEPVPFSPLLINNLLDIIHNAILIVDSRNRIIFANHRTAKMSSGAG